MKIQVYTTPAEVNEEDIRGELVVIIDVLRTGSSILQALANECKEIIPVESVERAIALQSALFDSDVLLCGERDGVKISGFDLGNSPYEYTKERVSNKFLIFSTTNGTVAMVKARKGGTIYLCGFQNMEVTAAKVSSLHATPQSETGEHKDYSGLTIICSGQNNHFALEDIVCAGMLIFRIQQQSSDKSILELTDGARSAMHLYNQNANKLKTMIKQVDHGLELIKLGMEKDLEFCIQTDTIPILPVYVDGKIQRLSN